jgi:hypothetical protein
MAVPSPPDLRFADGCAEDVRETHISWVFLADRDAFRARLGEGANVLFAECRAPAAVLLARARDRARDAARVSDAGPDVVRLQLVDVESLDEVDARDHVLLRSDRPVAAILAELADAVDRRAVETVVLPARIRDNPAVAETDIGRS